MKKTSSITLMTSGNLKKQILAYTSAALRQMLNDIHFTNQLKAVGMHDIPQQVANILKR